MFESPKNNKETSGVEKDANYEDNDSLLLFSRLDNPQIRKQLIDFIYQVESEADDGKTIDKNQIEGDIRDKISKVKNSTNISFAHKEDYPFHNSDRMVIGHIDPINKSKQTAKQTSISEAHEKGHVVRDYSGDNEEIYRRHLSVAFDTKKFEIPKREIDIYIENRGGSSEGTDLDSLKEQYIEYLLDPKEVVERMSQLKNYFGFRGSEIFTLEHLRYAKENYVKDVGEDNGMSAFFNLISPETEQKFLRLINSVGV